ncbi:MAG: flagellar biosynthesis anti-sigma factor FlgM [Planctomycetaceae bacterium]|nr:flagellar biosynthesis anti-sigma factor FlgM [Planctomycetaceae bacterium]
MSISGVGGAGGNWPVSRTVPPFKPVVEAAGGLNIPRDQLEISKAAQLFMELTSLDPKTDPAERQALINRIREEIAQGTYDTDEKLEKALMKFLEQQPSDE